ncbi:hypothetical protein AB4160_14295 [Shewanella sp. 10N.286.51.B8]|uniref:hypothetical protein n=1 Tax=Shewanella sp. 10N.286.51.B8 TaxID=3229708 RepID=UPI00354D8EF4
MLKLNQQVRIQVDDVFIQYHIFDINQPIMVTFPPGSKPFNEHDISSGQSAWGFDFFAKRQMNVISFVHIGKNNLFESPIFECFIDKLRADLAIFPSRIGYGASRGGFAVALHANKLAIDRALLLMPLSTYNPIIAPWVHKAAELKSERGLDASQCNAALTIIYDPLSLRDKLHKRRFSHCVKALTITGVGHRIPRALLNLGMLSSVVLEYREGDINSDYFYQRTRNRRYLSFYFKHVRINNTGKMTNKRLMVIYRYKFVYFLRNLYMKPYKILAKFKVNVLIKIKKLGEFNRL